LVTGALMNSKGTRVELEVNWLGWERTLTWAAAPDFNSYRVIRGARSDLLAGTYGACVADVVVEQHDDVAIPAPGDPFVYLIQGDSLPCGPSTLGFDGRGLLRTADAYAVCP